VGRKPKGPTAEQFFIFPPRALNSQEN
jgi:hypothetical protein